MQIPAKFYAHSSKESSRDMYKDAMTKAGQTTTPELEREACYAGYEVEFVGFWEDGVFWATDVNNMRLAEPVKL